MDEDGRDLRQHAHHKGWDADRPRVRLRARGTGL